MRISIAEINIFYSSKNRLLSATPNYSQDDSALKTENFSDLGCQRVAAWHDRAISSKYTVVGSPEIGIESNNR